MKSDQCEKWTWQFPLPAASALLFFLPLLPTAAGQDITSFSSTNREYGLFYSWIIDELSPISERFAKGGLERKLHFHNAV